MAETGSYRLVRALDTGGRVHEARHDRLPGRFAVKLFGEVDARAFHRGVQQASALRHPSIVRVVDYGSPTGRAYVVMEWADGRSLAALLAEGGPFPPSAVARIVDGVALGLQAAHRQGVAHGHLAPARVLVSARGSASDDETPGAEHTKILGFGLGSAALAAGLSFTEATPYAAPEQVGGAPRPLADQYALGAIAYELLTGEPPGGNERAGRPPRSIREYDPTIGVSVDEVVQRALSFDPAARWPDVHTFAARLREAVFADTFAEDALEERTRLAPLPLTVTKAAAATPTPIELPPTIASVDVDLGTPAPSRRVVPHELPLPPAEGVIAMNPPNRQQQQPFSMPSQMPGHFPSAHSTHSTHAGGRAPHYGIRPTPTFSFADELQLGPPSKRRRRRSGGGFGLLLLVVAAGVGGYLSVEKRVWQQAEPLVARAKELAHSLQTLAPGASPEPAAPAAAPSGGAAPAAAVAGPAGTQAAVAPPPPTAPPPEVVPIEPATAPARTAPSAAHHASRVHHARAEGREKAERPAHAERPRPSKVLSDEAATEEALLAPP
jgi:serine/threonine-protein kinase